MNDGNRPRFGFVPDSGKYFIGPKNCRALKERLKSRIERLSVLEHNPFNQLELRGRQMGIIACGGAYGEARERFPDASILRLRLAYPVVEPDVVRLLDHLARREVAVFEEGDPVVLWQVRELACRLNFSVAAEKSSRRTADARNITCRLCPACPHRGALYALKSLGKTVVGDAGCSALASLRPLECVHAHTAMGASIATAAGMNEVSGGGVIALIGDAAFFHSGINALIDALRAGTNLLVVILDNGTAALTGGQILTAETGDESAPRIDWTKLLTGLGVGDESVHVMRNVHDHRAIRAQIEHLTGRNGLNALVVQGTCRYALGDLDALMAHEGENTVIRSWRNTCDDCPAIVARNGDACLVAAHLCGECTLCESLN